MRIVIGLGNPGEKYAKNRHNIAWLALDYWLENPRWTLNKKFKALTYEQGETLFVKPLSFMNESGQVAQKILSYYKLLPTSLGILRKKDSDLSDCLSVIHDDLDINFGAWKIATDSSSAGHRGVQSIINHLKTQKFTRLRLGIKNENLRLHIPADKFVLQNFKGEELSELPSLFSLVKSEIIK